MSTFSDLFAEIGIPAVLEHLGETVRYYPAAGGAPVDVTVTINRRVDVREGSDVVSLPDALIVTCGTDPNAAGGGVAEPQRGDAIWRSGNGDGEDVRYAFEGELINSVPAAWTAKFVRFGRKQVGMVRR